MNRLPYQMTHFIFGNLFVYLYTRFEFKLNEKWNKKLSICKWISGFLAGNQSVSIELNGRDTENDREKKTRIQQLKNRSTNHATQPKNILSAFQSSVSASECVCVQFLYRPKFWVFIFVFPHSQSDSIVLCWSSEHSSLSNWIEEVEVEVHEETTKKLVKADQFYHSFEPVFFECPFSLCYSYNICYSSIQKQQKQQQQ